MTKCNGFNRYEPDFRSNAGSCKKCAIVDLGICAAGFSFSGSSIPFDVVHLLKLLHFVNLDTEICRNKQQRHQRTHTRNPCLPHRQSRPAPRPIGRQDLRLSAEKRLVCLTRPCVQFDAWPTHRCFPSRTSLSTPPFAMMKQSHAPI